VVAVTDHAALQAGTRPKARFPDGEGVSRQPKEHGFAVIIVNRVRGARYPLRIIALALGLIRNRT